MGFFHDYPYTDFHEINLDWILRQIMKLHKDYDEFKALNTITFSGEWDITKQYPAWTIVNTNNGTEGYISLKPVPAGITIDNNEYWQLIANYTNILAELQNRVLALELKQRRVQTIKDRKFLFLGDSYYLGSTGIVMSGEGWADFVIEYLGLDSDHYVKASLDDVVGVPHQIATPGFSASVGTHRSFKTILESVRNNMTLNEANAITDIVVCGGYNDINKNDIEAGILDYANYAKANFVNAKLWCGEIGNDGGFDRTTQRFLLFTRVAPTYQEACAKCGITYLSSAEHILTSADLFMPGSTAHPIVDGYKRIGQAIANEILGGGTIFPIQAVNAMTVNPVSWTTSSGSIEVLSYNQHEKVVVINDLTLVFTGSPITVGNLDSLLIELDGNGMLPTGIPTAQPINLRFVNNGQYLTDIIPCSVSFVVNNHNKPAMRIDIHNFTSFTLAALRIQSAVLYYPTYML